MRFTLLVLFALFVTTSLDAQIKTPVKWKTSYKHISGNEYDLVFTATIENGWYVYSQYINGDGPIPTTFEFEDTPGVIRIGKVKESGKKKSGFDPVFEIEVVKFTNKAVFKQRVKVINSNTTTVKGAYEFMTCNDKTCLAPEYVPFSISIKPKVNTPVVSKNNEPEPNPEPVIVAKPEPIKGTVTELSGGSSLPVTWTVEGIRVNKTEYDVIFKANIKDDWELFSQYLNGGPMPTTFEFDNRDERIEIGRKAKETGGRFKNYDDRFNTSTTRFKGDATFTQRIEIEKGSRSVKGDIYYVAAKGDDVMPPHRVAFAIDLPSKITPTEAELKKQERERKKREAERLAQLEKEKEENPEVATTETDTDTENTEVATTETEEPLNEKGIPAKYDGDKFDYTYITEDCSNTSLLSGMAEKSGWLIFLLGFGGGLIALLTPCVFPMIPITVSFFTKRSKNKADGIKNALIYGASIIAIYVSLGLIVTSIFGPQVLNEMATNAVFNLVFFALFVIFAISFFGYFEITLPSSWANSSDQLADRGGLLGIFFMAFTLALVSFSCTGPIIGTLLVETARGAGETILGVVPVRPLLGMLGFSAALALPFALFAAFPGWLNSLPKSGGWMTTVKVTLGFLELALALKFLSVVDLTYHWDFLKIELFLGLWIAIFLGLAAYMFGFIKFPHDTPLKKLPKGRYVMGMMSLAFVAYLGKGLVEYKPLKLLSGIAPPVHYNFFKDESKEEYPDCPQGIRCFKDYDEGLAYAKEANLPVMIDFTGHGCVNCRKMEETVWGEPEVKKILAEDYVLVSLYVDDREKLEEPYKDDKGRSIRRVGDKWKYFQIDHFGSNAQPLYVLIDNNEKVLNQPREYTPDKEKYVDFLECGLARYNQMSAKE